MPVCTSFFSVMIICFWNYCTGSTLCINTVQDGSREAIVRHEAAEALGAIGTEEVGTGYWPDRDPRCIVTVFTRKSNKSWQYGEKCAVDVCMVTFVGVGSTWGVQQGPSCRGGRDLPASHLQGQLAQGDSSDKIFFVSGLGFLSSLRFSTL